MKRVEITINSDGSTELDFKEGFSGMSCVEKSKQIELMIGGGSVERQEKPEYYESESRVDLGVDIFR